MTDADFKLCPRCGHIAVTTTVNLFDASITMKRCLKCKVEWNDDREEKTEIEEA